MQTALTLPGAAGARRSPPTGRSILTGHVASINEASADDGSWVMGHLQSDDGSTRTPFVGHNLLGLEVGRTVRLNGVWERHPSYGLQFRADGVESHLPVIKDGIIRYIAANIRFCGPTRAEQLIDHLGLDCLDLLAKEPTRVRDVFSGKTGAKMECSWREWAESYQADRRSARVTVDLMGAGMTFALARRVQQVFRKPGEAENVLLRHPYRLVEVPGIGFRRADHIARHMGVAADDPHRIAAGVAFSLDQAMELGHSALPPADLERRAAKELELGDLASVRAAVERGIEAGTLILEQELIFSPRVRDTEIYVAGRLAFAARQARPLFAGARARTDAIIAASGLSPTQAEAVRMALGNAVSILTGRPGSGKTTTTKTYVACCEELGWNVAIAAPTGKAAARAAEVTGRPASTIHRLIGQAFGEKAPRPIEADVVVLDESSMVDLDVTAWLLRNIDLRRTRLLFVGDKDQLPSVGHGQVFADMIESGALPTIELREIFRQAASSRVILNAHRLLDGQPLLLDNADGSDFLFADVTQQDAVGPDGFPLADDPTRPQREQEEALRRLGKALAFLIRQKGAVPVRDIQVLAPMRRGLLGIDNLNTQLQALLNPDGQVGPFIGGNLRVRIGDRVIQTKNDYGVPGGLFNGEQGEVLAVDVPKEKVVARFDDRVITLQGLQLARLRPAWAITVHRSQGSEFPYTILMYHTSHSIMLTRALLYTAITRAQKMLVLVGNYAALEITRRASRRDAGVRHTGLRARIAEACGGPRGDDA